MLYHRKTRLSPSFDASVFVSLRNSRNRANKLADVRILSKNRVFELSDLDTLENFFFDVTRVRLIRNLCHKIEG